MSFTNDAGVTHERVFRFCGFGEAPSIYRGDGGDSLADFKKDFLTGRESFCKVDKSIEGEEAGASLLIVQVQLIAEKSATISDGHESTSEVDFYLSKTLVISRDDLAKARDDFSKCLRGDASFIHSSWGFGEVTGIGFDDVE